MTTTKETSRQLAGIHFFASSVAMWATTTEDRTLPELIKLMEKDGYPYNLFLIPTSPETTYAIKMYQPQVEGSQWLGYFQPNAKKRK